MLILWWHRAGRVCMQALTELLLSPASPRSGTHAATARATCGLYPCAGVDERQAESVVLRGPRRAGGPVRADEAAQLLDSALLLEGECRGHAFYPETLSAVNSTATPANHCACRTCELIAADWQWWTCWHGEKPVRNWAARMAPERVRMPMSAGTCTPSRSAQGLQLFSP